MSEINKPCALFIIPPAYEDLDKYCDALAEAGYEICLARYGKASQERATGDVWQWIIEECKNLAVVVWPGTSFCDAWVHDEIQKEEERVSKIVAKLVAQGAAEHQATNFDYGNFDDTVIMYGSAEVFVQEVIGAIKSLRGNNHGSELK